MISGEMYGSSKGNQVKVYKDNVWYKGIFWMRLKHDYEGQAYG